jgi:regulator of protease activity HflC (stomatin/prohibitin superfamily)
MRVICLLSFAPLLAATGCGVVVEPGHRGLIFDTRLGLKHDVLPPGKWHPGVHGNVIDYDVTYSTKHQEVRTISADRMALVANMSLRYRPVESQLYDLTVEIGSNYYDEVVQPEFMAAARGVLARHSYKELEKNNQAIEDEVEAELRNRIKGKHIEVSSVTFERIEYAQEVIEADRALLVGERESERKRSALENDALRQKLELQHEEERSRQKVDAELRAKETERKLAEEQAAIEKVQAETEAATKVTKAKADAEAIKLLADAHAKEKKAEAVALTPLAVMMHAYDALGRLGGEKTTFLFGDFSKVPQFLFPNVPMFRNALGAPLALRNE